MITRKLSTLTLLAVFGGALTAYDVNAVQKTPADMIDEEIIVTATRSPYSLQRVPATVRVISEQEIQQSAARTVADLLRNQGTVQVRDSMGNGRDASLSLRGFGASANALVLVDGRKLNNSDLGGPDLTAIALGDVERIEILEGGAGALYGDQAVGGVINIITRKVSKRQGQVAVGRGSYDAENYRASYSGALDSGWYYRLASDLDRSDGYRDDSSVNYENYSTAVGYRYGGGEVFMDGRHTDSEYRLTGALSAAAARDERRQAGSSFNNYGADIRAFRAGIDHQFGAGVQLLATYSDRDEDVLIQGSSISFGDTTTLQARRVKTFDPRLILSGDKLRLTVGVDSERVDYDFALNSIFGPAGSAHRNHKRSEYAQLLYRPLENLEVMAGVRHAALDTDVDPYGIRYDQSATVQQLGAVWRGDNWRIHLNRDETFRFPLADENVDFFGVINPLRVQRGVAWELGGSRQWRAIELNMALFEQNNRDEIGFDPGAGLWGANTNFDDTRRRGVTTEVRWQALPSLDVRGVYTYIDARFMDGRYEGNRVPDVARELIKVNANYVITPAASIFAELVYTGSQTLDLANEAGSLGGYTVANLAATLRWQAWTLQARINNITGKEYSEFVTFFFAKGLYPSPERNGMLTLSYDF